MNRRESNPSFRPIDSLIEELQGYLDLNMQTEARKIIRTILRHPFLNADGLAEAVRAIGMGMKSPRVWRSFIEAAYRNLPSKERRGARASMLAYYNTVWDPDAALQFCSVRDLQSPADLMFAMDVLLHLGKLKEAKIIARKCESALNSDITRFDAGCLIDALASYCVRTRQWQRALELWSHAPREEPLARNAATGIAEAFIAAAMDAITGELAVVESLEKKASTELALSLPGVEDGMLQDTKKDLLRLKRGLERLIPEKRRVAFGL